MGSEPVRKALSSWERAWGLQKGGCDGREWVRSGKNGGEWGKIGVKMGEEGEKWGKEGKMGQGGVN